MKKAKKTAPMLPPPAFVIDRLMAALGFASHLSPEARQALRNVLIVSYAAGCSACARTVRQCPRVFCKRGGK